MVTTNDDNIHIYLIDGMTVNEAVTENSDGSYTVFVNADLCQAKRLAAVAHALEHIKGNDFEETDVQEIELKAHK